MYYNACRCPRAVGVRDSGEERDFSQEYGSFRQALVRNVRVRTSLDAASAVYCVSLFSSPCCGSPSGALYQFLTNFPPTLRFTLDMIRLRRLMAPGYCSRRRCCFDNTLSTLMLSKPLIMWCVGVLSSPRSYSTQAACKPFGKLEPVPPTHLFLPTFS